MCYIYKYTLGHIHLKHETATWHKSEFYFQSTFWSPNKLDEKRKAFVWTDKWEGKGGLNLTKTNWNLFWYKPILDNIGAAARNQKTAEEKCGGKQ